MKCPYCQEEHPLEEMELSFKRPDALLELEPEYRSEKCKESDDLCHINSKEYFVRCVLPLTVETRERPYRLGVWAQISEDDFRTVVETWKMEDQSSIPPITGYLANNVPEHKESLGCMLEIILKGPTERPEIHIKEKDNTLFKEQQSGISEQRAIEYSMLIFH